MNSYLQLAFVASAIGWMAGSLSGKTGEKIGAEQTLSIHLYNDAEVSPRTLHWAIVETNRLFRAAGIQLYWEQVSREAWQSAAACPQENERRSLLMRLMLKAPLTASPGALGTARPFAQAGTQVSIFIDRLEALRHSMTTEDYVMLGHMMAHEIGHVLLHSTEHSAGGVMQTRWTGMSWHLASQGLLAFRPEEAERMNAGLAEFRNGVRSTGVGVTCSNAYRKTQP